MSTISIIAAIADKSAIGKNQYYYVTYAFR